MGTNCAPLLADLFLYSYEAEFIQSLLSVGWKRLASQFNFTYRYIDDVLSINNQVLRIISVRYIPLSLRSKTQRRATLLLPTWIYSCQSDIDITPIFDPLLICTLLPNLTFYSVSPACRKRRLKGRRYIAIVADTAQNNNLT